MSKSRTTRSVSSVASSKDNMSIGSAESLAPRWVSPEKSTNSKIHWIGILRDNVMLSEFCNEPDNPKILQMSRRFLKKENVKVDWEFKTYAVQSQRRMVHAIQFHVYDKIPLEPGARAKLVGLQIHTFLNGESVRVIEYQSSTDKYLIRPSIPLPQAQKLATTGMLVVPAKHLVASEQEVRVWKFAILYDGKSVSQNSICHFLEKIMMLTENFRKSDEWCLGGEMSVQGLFAPILAAQMENFEDNNESIDESMEYSKSLIESNQAIIASRSTTLHGVK